MLACFILFNHKVCNRNQNIVIAYQPLSDSTAKNTNENSVLKA